MTSEVTCGGPPSSLSYIKSRANISRQSLALWFLDRDSPQRPASITQLRSLRRRANYRSCLMLLSPIISLGREAGPAI
eukprot:scaffold503680_cov17-Prasinocladus_malaysianus.AAC.1